MTETQEKELDPWADAREPVVEEKKSRLRRLLNKFSKKSTIGQTKKRSISQKKKKTKPTFEWAKRKRLLNIPRFSLKSLGALFLFLIYLAMSLSSLSTQTEALLLFIPTMWYLAGDIKRKKKDEETEDEG